MNKVEANQMHTPYDTGQPSPTKAPLETMNPGEVALASAVRRFRCGRPRVRSGRCCSCSRSCARLMLSPGAPTSVPASTASVIPTVVPPANHHLASAASLPAPLLLWCDAWRRDVFVA